MPEPATINKFSLHEDWVVVLLGFSVILLAIGGIKPLSPVYGWSNAADFTHKIIESGNLSKIGIQFLFVLLIAFAGVLLTGKSVRYFIYTFTSVYIITILALIIAGNKTIKSYNLEAVIFSLSLGLIISNLFKLPEWFRAALSTELFVKIGLVLLGTTIIFSDILKAGSYGLLQALVVVISVWYFAFWLCKKLKVDSELTMMISSAVSICGVSAAIATAGAIKGDTKKLSYVISLVLICAIPMMIGMPYLAKWMGLSQEVTGAWLGGSIDTTGAVVASGSLVGEEALKISTIVKFSQNVLLGVAAFTISVYWTYNKNAANGETEKPTLRIIWERFPKFVLGFVAASLLFSFVLSAEIIAGVKDSLKGIQSLWFVLAFTSIGLETKFSDLLKGENRKPMYAFLIAQLFNVIITLIIAYLLFRK
jgi:uncharacterized integral membrane protein (TIGR00698 family)